MCVRWIDDASACVLGLVPTIFSDATLARAKGTCRGLAKRRTFAMCDAMGIKVEDSFVFVGVCIDWLEQCFISFNIS